MFLAYSMSKDRSEGAVFGMWHWRVGDSVHRKFKPLGSWKSGQKHKKIGRDQHSALVNSCYFECSGITLST